MDTRLAGLEERSGTAYRRGPGACRPCG